jgi:hypothetical protein
MAAPEASSVPHTKEFMPDIAENLVPAQNLDKIYDIKRCVPTSPEGGRLTILLKPNLATP